MRKFIIGAVICLAAFPAKIFMIINGFPLRTCDIVQYCFVALGGLVMAWFFYDLFREHQSLQGKIKRQLAEVDGTVKRQLEEIRVIEKRAGIERTDD